MLILLICARLLLFLLATLLHQFISAFILIFTVILIYFADSFYHIPILSHVSTGLKPPVLLFMQSKERAKDLYRELVYDGINVDVVHAERTQQQREDIIRCVLYFIFVVLLYII